jgi:hypothetical protein
MTSDEGPFFVELSGDVTATELAAYNHAKHFPNNSKFLGRPRDD